MFAYADAARYRLGTNYQQLPTNHALCPVYSPFQRDGFMNFSTNYGDDPNYVGSMLRPTSFRAFTHSDQRGPVVKTNAGGKDLGEIVQHEKWVGEVLNFTSTPGPQDYEQATGLWKVLGRDPGHQDRFVGNVADSLSKVTNAELLRRVYGKSVELEHKSLDRHIILTCNAELFALVDKDLGVRSKAAVEKAKN